MSNTFDQWVRFCFERPAGGGSDTDDGAFDTPDPSTLASYLGQLFEDPAVLIPQFSTDQIGEGLWFVCGIQSGYFWTAREASVPIELQIRWVRAVKKLYSDLFARVCAPSLGHLNGWPEPGNRINTVCYMFWDMDCLEGAAMFPGHEHLVQPIFDVIDHALGLPHLACAESALHGLGHLHAYHPARVAAMIDEFLHRGTTSPELATYARAARKGCVN